MNNEKEPLDGAASPMPLKKATARRRARTTGEDHVGKALRSVFEETIGETIPAEMLSLLGKLS